MIDSIATDLPKVPGSVGCRNEKRFGRNEKHFGREPRLVESGFNSFCDFVGGGWREGVLVVYLVSYGSRKSVEGSLLCAFSKSNACVVRDEPSFKRVGVRLSRKPPKLRS